MKNKTTKVTIGIVCLIIVIVFLGYYIGKSKVELSKPINTIEKVDNISKKEFKDISNKEIVETVNKAYNLYSEIYRAVDNNDCINLNVPSGVWDPVHGSNFYRALEPYEKPYKRENALKKYFVNYKMLSGILDSKSKYGLHKFIKRGTNYYFCVHELSPNVYTSYDKVVNRKEEGDVVEVTLKGEWSGEAIYENVKLVIDGNDLKICGNLLEAPKENEAEKSGWRIDEIGK